MFNIVVFGAPGSGKGTQSAKLIERYGIHHISTGEVLRKHIADGTELGKTAKSFIDKGQLIPDELMISILADTIDQHPEAANGVIFDGFPRTIPQAEALNELLEKRGAKLDAVVGLEVADSGLIDRMIKRGQETGRADDNPQTISNRLKVYHSQTQPLRDYYMKRGKYHAIPGSGSVDDIFGAIIAELDDIHMSSRRQGI